MYGPALVLNVTAPDTNRFPIARMSSRVTAWSAVFLVLLLAAGVAPHMFLTPEQRASGTIRIALLVNWAFLIGLVAICGLWRPRAFRVTPEAIAIERLWLRSATIPLHDVRSVDRVEASVLARTRRVFGVGGLGGMVGAFANPILGHFDCYCTDASKLVLITARTKYLISPEDPDGFLDRCQERLYRPNGG